MYNVLTHVVIRSRYTLLASHPVDILGSHPHVFSAFVDDLRDCGGVSKIEERTERSVLKNLLVRGTKYYTARAFWMERLMQKKEN